MSMPISVHHMLMHIHCTFYVMLFFVLYWGDGHVLEYLKINNCTSKCIKLFLLCQTVVNNMLCVYLLSAHIYHLHRYRYIDWGGGGGGEYLHN